jgi:hypothetical protein
MAQLWCAHHVAEAAVEAAAELNQNMLLVKFDLKFISRVSNPKSEFSPVRCALYFFYRA